MNGVERRLKPRRTVESNFVFRLEGGTEDNDLWVCRDSDRGEPIQRSCWVPTDEQRQAIADGANLELVVWGIGHPPVALNLSDAPLGRGSAND